MFQSLKGVSGKFQSYLTNFQRSFREVSRKFHGYFKKFSIVFQVTFKGSLKFNGCLREVSEVFQGTFNKVKRVFPREFLRGCKGVKCASRKFQTNVSTMFQERVAEVLF